MNSGSLASILVIDEKYPAYEPYIATAVEWAEARSLLVTYSTDYRQAIDMCLDLSHEPYDIVIGGIAYGDSAFDLIDALDASRPSTVPIILNSQTYSILHIDPLRRRLTESRLSKDNLIKAFEAYYADRQPVHTPVPTGRRNVRVTKYTVRGDRTDVDDENTVSFVADLPNDRQLIFLGELSDQHNRSEIVRDYLVDHLREIVAMSRKDLSSNALETIVRSINADLAVLRYLDYEVDIAMTIALIDTANATVGVIECGSESPILASRDATIRPMPVDRYRTFPLEPGTSIYFHTRRFFPPQPESDTVKRRFFRRLAYSAQAVDPSSDDELSDRDENVAGTLIGVVVENE